MYINIGTRCVSSNPTIGIVTQGVREPAACLPLYNPKYGSVLVCDSNYKVSFYVKK